MFQSCFQKHFPPTFTCFSKDSKGQRHLGFTLRQEPDGDATTDALHLVRVLAVLTQGLKYLSHVLPVLLLGTELAHELSMNITLAQHCHSYNLSGKRSKVQQNSTSLTSSSTMAWAKFRYSGMGVLVKNL